MLVFPGVPDELRFVCEHCLASFVFHAGYLNETLTPENPLFTNALFLNDHGVRETSLSTSQSLENSLQQLRETLREFAEL